MNGVPIEVYIGVFLMSLSPDFVIMFIRARLSAILSRNPLIVRVLGASFLCLLNMVLFGFPQSLFGSALLEVSCAFLGICTGVLYYFIEDVRLGIARPGAIRVTKRAIPQDGESSVILGCLLWGAVTEEVLFRWYALMAPPTYGFLPLSVCVVVSCAAFAIAHQHFGTDVMVSRGVFGTILVLPVLFWGNLLFPIAAHVVYNGLVHLRPVQYIQIKKEL